MITLLVYSDDNVWNVGVDGNDDDRDDGEDNDNLMTKMMKGMVLLPMMLICKYDDRNAIDDDDVVYDKTAVKNALMDL